MTAPVYEYFGVRITGSVRIAVPLAHVESVLRIDPLRICPIPGVPPYFWGVVNQKGSLTWVFNFSHYLGLPQTPTLTGVSYLAAVITAQTDQQFKPERERKVACLVSDLEGIYTLDPRTLKPMPDQLKPHLRDLFVGLAIRSSKLEGDPRVKQTQIQTHQAIRVAVLDPILFFDLIHREGVTAALTSTAASPSPIPSPAA